MGQTDTFINAKLPSFSIILETENLANADLEGLSKSLASLIDQDLSPTCANDVLMIDSGDVPPNCSHNFVKNIPGLPFTPHPRNGLLQSKNAGSATGNG